MTEPLTGAAFEELLEVLQRDPKTTPVMMQILKTVSHQRGVIKLQKGIINELETRVKKLSDRLEDLHVGWGRI